MCRITIYHCLAVCFSRYKVRKYIRKPDDFFRFRKQRYFFIQSPFISCQWKSHFMPVRPAFHASVNEVRLRVVVFMFFVKISLCDRNTFIILLPEKIR